MRFYLVDQFQHMHWANQKLITVLRENDDTPEQAINLMSHIICAEHIWLARASGQNESLKPWSRLTLAECGACATTNHAGYLKLIEHLDEEQLHEPIAFKLTNGTPMSSTLGDILAHVPLHGAHHRGQIAKLLAQNAITPPAVDYILYSMQRDG